ncbi:MAG: hypothetical protein JNL39_12855 [Opitutaceae bacterium]|nr:hypothetical protein [Opitutaceae bacterium]
MNLDPEEMTFARDLVKASRQRIHHVKWVDRDGTARVTALNAGEWERLNRLAGRFRVGPAEVLRQVAYIPNARAGGGAAPVTPSAPSSGPA